MTDELEQLRQRVAELGQELADEARWADHYHTVWIEARDRVVASKAWAALYWRAARRYRRLMKLADNMACRHIHLAECLSVSAAAWKEMAKFNRKGWLKALVNLAWHPWHCRRDGEMDMLDRFADYLRTT